MISIDRLSTELQALASVIQQILEECGLAITQITAVILQCLERRNRLMRYGNGSSATDAQYIVAEFINRFCFDHPLLAAFALTMDPSVLTFIGDASAFDCIFHSK